MKPRQGLRWTWISDDSMPALANAWGVEAAVGNQPDPELPTDKEDEEGGQPSRPVTRGGRLAA